MKHSEWLRLKAEGENICSILRQEGFCCTKQARRLSWKVSTPLSPPLVMGETGGTYVLTWLPAPVGNWSVIPNEPTLAREEILSVVQTALKQDRERMRSQRISSFENLNRPWAIARILPDAKHYIVARFFNRRDADDHLRVLRRLMPAADFEIVFDIPDETVGALEQS